MPAFAIVAVYEMAAYSTALFHQCLSHHLLPTTTSFSRHYHLACSKMVTSGRASPSSIISTPKLSAVDDISTSLGGSVSSATWRLHRPGGGQGPGRPAGSTKRDESCRPMMSLEEGRSRRSAAAALLSMIVTEGRTERTPMPTDSSTSL